ncbi:MAG: hypothetical protein KDA71_07710 [Planctomycetales bacterium]|nr:hypothetical protein [Planctomycetales bacterium]
MTITVLSRDQSAALYALVADDLLPEDKRVRLAELFGGAYYQAVIYARGATKGILGDGPCQELAQSDKKGTLYAVPSKAASADIIRFPQMAMTRADWRVWANATEAAGLTPVPNDYLDGHVYSF